MRSEESLFCIILSILPAPTETYKLVAGELGHKIGHFEV